MVSRLSIIRGEVPRKTCIVFFVIGTSESMGGARIGAVNSTLEQTIEKLREISADSVDAEINVALLEFSSRARWFTPMWPIRVENYYWKYLVASGKHDMGEAFRMLDEKLRLNSGFMQRPSMS